MLLDQIEKFDIETKKLVEKLLHKYRLEMFDKSEVKPEFINAEIQDLVKISAMTAKGNLTKAAKDAVEMRVRDDRRIQDQTERRLLELENQSLKAGLKAPLERSHVEHFLFVDHEVYQERLGSIIKIEIGRQDAAEEKLRVSIEKENERKRLATSAAKAKEETPEPKPEPTPEPENQDSYDEPAQVDDKPRSWRASKPSGTVPHRVTCVFELPVKRGISTGSIEAEIRKVLAKAGITTLKSVVVEAI
jgi:hypothetical protein